ncbi:MerR family transcriptional regulator [Actinoplanes sp. NEAU-A12]|uniref:MerR family transcriptional regulator n=1 Tax=Actinoplanes sandaracinus TaxID=3045177 RepID=A0ABT6WND0_9ACTN|nr:MerR family transcriptional regulator [Actinoplanes sandaracinus]MDI6101243.1 MerR family transcriptional regulator [Actinoplanes sandaracinus]
MYRPVDLARKHGLSAQAVRNYEEAGVIPPAARTASGYRVYTDQHATALGAYVALLPGYGYATAAVIMRSVIGGALEPALAAIDAAHVQLQRDRETVESVASAASILAGAAPDGLPEQPVSVGVVAHRLGVTPATLRKWERAGILAPSRSRNARVYTAEDVRDAELAHLLRRGGYLLGHIATVLDQVRAAGGPGPLAASLEDWRARLTARGRAMLSGSARLADYLERREQTYAAPPEGVTGGAAVLGDQGNSR